MKNLTYLKIVLLGVILFAGSGVAWGQTEQAIYSTGFESPDFTASTSYDNTTVKYQGPTNQQWGIIMGTASTTGPITSSQSLQMRSYASNTTLGSIVTNFDLAKVTKVTLKAKAYNSNTTSFKAYYSTNGGASWSSATTFTVTTNSGDFTYNISATGEFASVRIKFEHPTFNVAGRLTIDDVIVYGMVGSTPTVATPTFSPAAGTYYTSQNVNLSTTTPSANIYYTTDGSDPNNSGNGTLYSTAIPVSTTTTVKARAYADGYDPSAVASATFSLPTAVADIATLRSQTTGTTRYKLTGQAALTYQSAAGKVKYIQDATGAIIITDPSGIITSTYNLYDGITGITGTLATVNSTLQFTPVADPGAATATGLTVTPTEVTLNNLTTAYQAKLVKIKNVTFGTTGSFAANTNYTISDPTSTTGVLRTQYSDLNYISTPIPAIAQDITGVVLQYNTTIEIIPRSTTDFVNSPVAVTFNVDMNGTSGYTDVYIAGSFNGWSPTSSKMTTSGGNIYTFTTDRTINIGDVIEFKIVKDGSTWESIANRTYTAIAGTNTVNVYWDAAALPQLNWANLQFPATATIVSGNSLDVFAQVFEPGLTEAAGQGTDITAWVGYSTTDTNPNTWTNWVLATFNKQSGNNDEYTAPIGSALAGGKYYYASRFKYGLNDYVYGGLSGLWDATNSKSGVLTVIATEPTAHVTNPAATPNSSTEITLSWTDATANGYLIKGSAVSFDDIAAPVDGVAETNGTLVSNVTSGTQTYKFTGLSAETTYYFKIFPYNGSGEQINYKVDGSVPQASAKTYKAPTVLQAGDIAILQVNTDAPDRFSFVTFVDINPGTTISFTDNGFTSATAVSTNEGIKTYTAPALVPAGTVLNWVNATTDPEWTSSGSFALSNSGEQLFAYQGTWNSDQKLIFGVNLRPWLVDGGTYSASNSFLPADLTDNVTAFALASAADNCYYSNITSGTANALKSLITYNTNWTTSSTDQGAQSWTFALGTSTSLNANSSVFNLTVATGEIFTLEAAKQLTINGSLTNNGTFTLQSGATVITNGVVSGSGINKVNQDLTYRTWYMSSPVASATPAGMLRIKSYNETTNLWAIDNSTMVIGKGYSITPIDGTNNILFTGGALNTGEKTITLDKKGSTSQAGFNSVGNPYPSYIDWKAMVTKNSAVLETNTMWYRSKIEGSFKFYTVDAGGVVVPANTAITAFIPPMQGFWVKTNTDASTLYFEDNMRSHAGTVANPSPNPLKAPAAANSEISLLRLQVSNGTNTDEAVIYSSANATNGYDFYDSPKMMNNDATIPEIHTTLNSQPIVINVMNSLPLDTEIGLAFVPGNATSFSLKASEITNLPADVKVILKDYANSGAETDLTDGVTAYDFAPATFTGDRFSVIFRSAGSTTGVDTNIGKCISVYSTGNCIQVTVNSTLSETASVRVFNSVGQQVVNQRLTSHTTTVNGNFKSGVYVVKVSNGTATAATQKIVIK